MSFAEKFSALAGWIQGVSYHTWLVVAFLTFGVGMLWGRGGKGKDDAQRQSLEQELAHTRKRVESLGQIKKRLEGSVDALKRKNGEMRGLTSLLPDAVEKLNTAGKLEDLLRTLIKITERLVGIQDVSIFLRDREVLVLGAASEAASVPSPAPTIRIGEGRVGWVAQKGITMRESDFEEESNLVKASMADDPLSVPTRICSPMIYNGKLLGVVNVGETPSDPEQGLRMVRMITSLGALAMGNIMLKNQLLKGSETDSLTGLSSLQHFLGWFGKELNKARRYERPLSLIHFDLDAFQRYNEQNGYLAGDEVLRMVSKIFSDHLREQDLVARYGGKEFIVGCPETLRESAGALAEKLRGIVEAHPFPHMETMPDGRISVSGGVCTYPRDGSDEAELIREAVAATNISKEAGGNRISLAGSQQETGQISLQK
jgi:diguanylate cyclase (GGDEF)-like protein